MDTASNLRSSKTYLALGDSYTIGQSVSQSDRYPVQTAKLLNNAGLHFSAPEIIAMTGWTTADLQKAIGNYHFKDSLYDIVTLLIGVNNEYQGRSQSEYANQFTALLQKSIQLAGGNASHVIVISIPDYSVTPFANGRNDKNIIAAQIDSFNAINKKASQNYGTSYLYITDETRKAAIDETLIASDGLHYSGKEYGIWAGNLAVRIEKILH
jgi:lysophospholipase L1-like esterase